MKRPRSDRLVEALGICGLVMLGSESPLERLTGSGFGLPPGIHATHTASLARGAERPDGGETPDGGEGPDLLIHVARPSRLRPEMIRIIHARHDAVISRLQAEQLAAAWQVPCTVYHSAAKPDDPACAWSDDVQHDFISLDLLKMIFTELTCFLRGVHTPK